MLSLKKERRKKKKDVFPLNSTTDEKNYCIITNYLQLWGCQHIIVVNQGYVLKYPKSVFTNQHS